MKYSRLVCKKTAFVDFSCTKPLPPPIFGKKKRQYMKYLQKQQLLEQIIYATMWILILGTPLIGLLLDDEHPLEMSQIGKLFRESRQPNDYIP